jgi:3-methylcrotonyl-CoA carboxylase alpha subunit
MRAALAQVHIVGPKTNVAFLSRLVASRSFVSADLDTSLIEREAAALAPPAHAVPDEALQLAALAELLDEAETDNASAGGSPWRARDGWRLNGRAMRTVVYQSGEASIPMAIMAKANGWELTVAGRTVAAAVEHGQSGLRPAHPVLPPSGGKGRLSRSSATCVPSLLWGEGQGEGARQAAMVSAEIGGKRLSARVVAFGETRHVFLAGDHIVLTRVPDLPSGAGAETPAGGLRAKMPGRIVALLAGPGTKVAKGAPLLVMEAMKMEHTLTAPADGTVTGCRCAVGDQVSEGAELIDFEAGV